MATNTRLKNIFSFINELLQDFSNNQGYLLSGALAYYILLSLTPLLILTVIILANIIDEASLLAIISSQLAELFPTSINAIMQQVKQAYSSKILFSYLGIISLVIFSSLIFRTLQKIMRVIFKTRIKKRLSLKRIVIPYVYMLIFILLSFAFTLLSTLIDTINISQWIFFSYKIDVSPLLGNLTRFLLLLTNFTLLTLFYKIFPQTRIKWKHAMFAALYVGILWVGLKQILLYFFQHFSSISIIYGALSSFFILLISLEFFSLILLFGAQFIATYQRQYKKRQAS